jgi:hypothetical protein
MLPLHRRELMLEPGVRRHPPRLAQKMRALVSPSNRQTGVRVGAQGDGALHRAELGDLVQSLDRAPKKALSLAPAGGRVVAQIRPRERDVRL